MGIVGGDGMLRRVGIGLHGTMRKDSCECDGMTLRERLRCLQGTMRKDRGDGMTLREWLR
jgi:hypothetical protein